MLHEHRSTLSQVAALLAALAWVLAHFGALPAGILVALATLSASIALLTVFAQGEDAFSALRAGLLAGALSASTFTLLRLGGATDGIILTGALLFTACALRASNAVFIGAGIFAALSPFWVFTSQGQGAEALLLALAFGALIVWRRLSPQQRRQLPAVSRSGARHEAVSPAKPGIAVSDEELESSERMAQRAAEVVGESLHRLIATLRAGTRSQNAFILWFDDQHRALRMGIAELSTEACYLQDEMPITGALLAAHQTQRPAHATPDEALPWRDEAQSPVRALVEEIRDEGMSLGFLCVERHAERRGYQQADEVVIASLAQEAARVVRAERLLLDAARTRRDMEVLYEAAEALNSALSESDVYIVVRDIFARMLGDVSVAIYHEDPGHDVLRLSWSTPGFAPPQEVSARDSLIGLSINRRHSLPYRPGGEPDDPPVFGSRDAAATSIFVSPLTIGHETRGAIVMLSNQRSLFDPAMRERIGLVVNYVAASLANARAYEQMVVRATTDGMTGLLNHVTFKDRAAQAIERAERTERPLSAVLLDIDHFKSVNDTHGHAVGDAVIRAVAAAIRDEARKVDLAARYGGEEFALALEDTDTDGALLFANRLREHVARLVHSSSAGDFSVTISLGVAELGSGGQRIEELLKHADEALYVSKREGRDRATRYAAPTTTDRPAGESASGR